jgi:hypothetical protein
MHKIDSEENETTSKKSATNKFRKTKKYLSINNSNANSISKYQTKAKSKNTSTLNEEMMNVSAAFTELKRRNISFLC